MRKLLASVVVLLALAVPALACDRQQAQFFLERSSSSYGYSRAPATVLLREASVVVREVRDVPNVNLNVNVDAVSRRAFLPRRQVVRTRTVVR